ncbi:MAG TPA: ATP-binding protein [Bryobacteraceae bacterium]|nr:ATP-binding protein [Bryobacteraceae bacterium]
MTEENGVHHAEDDQASGRTDANDSPVPAGMLQILERQLQQSQKMATVGLLASGIAHDFNNLLTVINGHAALALASQATCVTNHLEIIRQAGEQAAAMVRRLLAFGCPQPASRDYVDLNELIGQLSQLVVRLLPENVHFEFEPATDLAPVTAVPGSIQQVIVNLVVNARDAMPRGGAIVVKTTNLALTSPLTDQHAVIPPGKYVRLIVRDTGEGMDEGTRERLFEPFYTTKAAGSGLGLATVRTAVHQSGGQISVSSDKGQGTTVMVYLPAAERSAMVREHPADAYPNGGSETILLAEDNPEVRTLTATVLEELGYHVLTAGSAKEAIDMARKAPTSLDLLITDFLLPDATGTELASELQKAHPELPLLIVSGYCLAALRSHGGLPHGATLIEKPFQPRAFASRVRQILDNRSNKQP